MSNLGGELNAGRILPHREERYCSPLSHHRVRLAARQILKKAMVCAPPVDVEYICAFFGIQLIYTDRLTIDGFSLCCVEDGQIAEPKPQVIVVNSTFIVQRQRFTIAHELGHVLLLHHTVRNCVPMDKKDREADVFASELLVPTPWLKSFVHGRGIKRLDELANIFFVSKKMMKLRLSEIL